MLLKTTLGTLVASRRSAHLEGVETASYGLVALLVLALHALVLLERRACRHGEGGNRLELVFGWVLGLTTMWLHYPGTH